MTTKSLILLQVLVMVLILGAGQQARDVADSFGDTLPEEQFGAQSQVLRVLDEAEVNDGPLAGTQLILQHQTQD